MKKMMRKLIAALLAVCCVPVTAVAASAEGLAYWGNTTWSEFSGMEPVNTYGWGGENKQYFVSEGGTRISVVVVHPRENVIRIVLREDADTDAAADALVDVLEQHFSGIRDTLNANTYETDHRRVYEMNGVQFYEPLHLKEALKGRVYELCIKSVPENAQELEADLLREFAGTRMISGFYGWGGTASYESGYVKYELLTAYPESAADWEAVQTYLDEHHTGDKVERYETEPNEDYGIEAQTKYRIVPSEELTHREKFELSCELWSLTGIGPSVEMLESASASIATAHNALERAGDVTLDCELDIMDVIAANKYILGVDTLCDTAKKNADVSGDGTPDAADTLAILKEVTGVTTDFAEP